MWAKRRLFKQDFLKCVLSVLLPSTKVIFDNCFIVILLGCTHSRIDCLSKRQWIENRIALLSATDQPTSEKVLSSSIRRVSSGDNKELQLKTLGKPTSVTLGARKGTKRILSIKLAVEMKGELGLSEGQCFGVLRYIIWSMFTLVTWKLPTWLLDLAHISADNPARIARHEQHSGTQTHRCGQFRWILSTTICGGLLPERRLITSIFSTAWILLCLI